MGILTFCINVTLDGCVDHQEGVADDETHAFFTRLMEDSGAMLWGRVIPFLNHRCRCYFAWSCRSYREDLQRRPGRKGAVLCSR